MLRLPDETVKFSSVFKMNDLSMDGFVRGCRNRATDESSQKLGIAHQRNAPLLHMWNGLTAIYNGIASHYIVSDIVCKQWFLAWSLAFFRVNGRIAVSFK